MIAAITDIKCDMKARKQLVGTEPIDKDTFPLDPGSILTAQNKKSFAPLTK